PAFIAARLAPPPRPRSGESRDLRLGRIGRHCVARDLRGERGEIAALDAHEDPFERAQKELALVPARGQRRLDAEHAALIQGVADAYALDVQQMTDHESRQRFLLAEIAEQPFLEGMPIEPERHAEEIAPAAHFANETGMTA